MRGLQITLFVIGLLVLSTQTFRHVYVKWIQPTDSVLDEFRTETEVDVVGSGDLDELVAFYRDAEKKVEDYEATASEQQISEYERWQREPYKSEFTIRQAIERWEAQNRSIFELRFYWLVGLTSVVLGVLAYRKVDRWLGMAGIIAGFTEMAVWTSPLWRAWGPQGAFDRLLNQKLLLSVLSVVLLITLWLVRARKARQSDASDHRGPG